jgi:hypothetical protein
MNVAIIVVLALIAGLAAGQGLKAWRRSGASGWLSSGFAILVARRRHDLHGEAQEDTQGPEPAS